MKRSFQLFVVLFIALIVFLPSCTLIQKPEEPEPVAVTYLVNILVDGKPLLGFDPFVYNYTYFINDELNNGLPVVQAVTKNITDVVFVQQVEDIPGTALISVTPKVEQGQDYRITRYTIYFVPLL